MPMYIDSSVLVAALAPDDIHYHQAREWLTAHVTEVLTSVLAEVEVGRALGRRQVPQKLHLVARRLLLGCERVELTEEIRAAAVGILPTTVRSLDAIHVATALVAGTRQFVSYDVRQQVAAEEAGLSSVTP